MEALLQQLCAAAEPMVGRQPRQPGQKELRYFHLFSGAAPAAAEAPAPAAAAPAGPDRLAETERRLAELEARVKALEDRLPPP